MQYCDVTQIDAYLFPYSTSALDPGLRQVHIYQYKCMLFAEGAVPVYVREVGDRQGMIVQEKAQMPANSIEACLHNMC